MTEIKKCLWKYVAEKNLEKMESKLENGLTKLIPKEGEYITLSSDKPCYNCNGYDVTCEDYEGGKNA